MEPFSSEELQHTNRMTHRLCIRWMNHGLGYHGTTLVVLDIWCRHVLFQVTAQSSCTFQCSQWQCTGFRHLSSGQTSWTPPAAHRIYWILGMMTILYPSCCRPSKYPRIRWWLWYFSANHPKSLVTSKTAKNIQKPWLNKVKTIVSHRFSLEPIHFFCILKFVTWPAVDPKRPERGGRPVQTPPTSGASAGQKNMVRWINL